MFLKAKISDESTFLQSIPSSPIRTIDSDKLGKIDAKLKDLVLVQNTALANKVKVLTSC